MPDLPPSLAASLAGRYRLRHPLGRGGMATVYLADDLQHERPVALKVLHPELAATLGPERFLREIRLCARLQHPHILPVHDSGEAGGQLWFTMPFIEGQSLRDRLRRERQLPVEEALRFTRHVAEALDYAHRRGVIHRDVKPENILLVEGQAVLADFGIARAPENERITSTGLALGTPAYMSPEQATGQPEPDARSDIYSLACVLYEMLAGEPPYTGPTPQVVIARSMSEPVPRLRPVREVPDWIEEAVHRGLAKAPADRFPSAAAFAAALERPVGTAAVPPPPKRRGGRRRLLATGLTLVLLLVVGLMVGRGSGRPATPVAPTRLAVLPFGVPAKGGFTYLAEGLVDLLSRNLDGAEDLVTVDPGTVLASAGGFTGTPEPDQARGLAQRLGAGQYVVGSVHAAGGRLRIQAALYRHAGATAETMAQATVEGDTAQLFDLVDRLSAELLAERGRGQGARLAQTAAVTTRSLPALKAYLGAEHDLRAARFDSALAGFRRAADLDTTFALAHYRLAVSAGWASRLGLMAPAVDRALATADRLAPRERRLLHAFAAYRRGTADSAERQYRAILADYPDDLEARFQLANVLYTYNPPRGRPRSEARALYDQVLEVDPEFICPI